MIADLIAFSIAHPFLPGVIIGGCISGGAFGIIGWCLGYEQAMRKIDVWMRPLHKLPKLDPIHGDVPELPPLRERRFSAVEHRESLS